VIFVPGMGSILIRKLEDGLKTRLRLRAAAHGRSMEEEARAILRRELNEPEEPVSLAALAKEIFGEDGVYLELPERTPVRDPPDFRK
jgi:plasmid stability protein